MRKRVDRIIFYKDGRGKVRWTYYHWNGNILADSGQGYRRETDARKGAERVTGCDLSDPNQIRVERDHA